MLLNWAWLVGIVAACWTEMETGRASEVGSAGAGESPFVAGSAAAGLDVFFCKRVNICVGHLGNFGDRRDHLCSPIG